MNQEQVFNQKRAKKWIVAGAIIVIIGGGILLSIAREDRYRRVPHLLVGQWVEVLDSNIFRMDVHDNRVTLTSRNGKHQTCYVDQARVTNNLFGAGGTISVHCKRLQVSASPLWDCYEPHLAADTERPYLIFISDDVSFGEVRLYSQNFVRCDLRQSLGLWQKR